MKKYNKFQMSGYEKKKTIKKTCKTMKRKRHITYRETKKADYYYYYIIFLQMQARRQEQLF